MEEPSACAELRGRCGQPGRQGQLWAAAGQGRTETCGLPGLESSPHPDGASDAPRRPRPPPGDLRPWVRCSVRVRSCVCPPCVRPGRVPELGHLLLTRCLQKAWELGSWGFSYISCYVGAGARDGGGGREPPSAPTSPSGLPQPCVRGGALGALEPRRLPENPQEGGHQHNRQSFPLV